MQLRFSILTIAVVLTLHQAAACPIEAVSPSQASTPLAYAPQPFAVDGEEERVFWYVRAGVQTTSDGSAFSGDVEDESVSSYIRELAATAGRDQIAAMEAIDKVSDTFDLRTFHVDVEDESVTSHFRELAATTSFPDVASLTLDPSARRKESGRVVPAFLANEDEMPVSVPEIEEAAVTGSMSLVPVAESMAPDGTEDR